MVKDKFINFYVSNIEKEKTRLKDGLMENQTITIEELRRNQGIYEGLQKALDLLNDALEIDNK